MHRAPGAECDVIPDAEVTLTLRTVTARDRPLVLALPIVSVDSCVLSRERSHFCALRRLTVSSGISRQSWVVAERVV